MAHSGKTMTFATDLLPHEDGVYNLGNTNLKWNIFGDITGNAANVTGTVAVANGGTGVTSVNDIVSTYGIEYIVGTQTSSTNQWKGVTNSASLYVGKIIAYQLPQKGTSTGATLTLTLSGGGTAGGPVYAGNTQLTTHYPQYSIMLMVWDGSGWRTNPYYYSDNDYRTRQTVDDTGTANRALLLSYYAPASATETTARVAYRSSSFYANPSTGTLYATTFNGDLTGDVTGDVTGNVTGNADTATSASKLGTSNLGSATKPIYLAAGVATECNTYAGGTAVTLNGTSKAANTASFYAPTAVGTQYQILVSGGSTNKVPVWTSAALLQSSTSTTANTAAYTILTLGNSANVSTTTAHSEGKIIIYSAATNSHTIVGASNSTENISNYTHTLPKQTGWIACGGTASGTVAGVASGTKLMYLADTGILTASTSNVANDGKTLMHLNSGELTASTQSVASGGKTLMYLNSGVLTASDQDVGNNTQSVYLDDGVLTATTYTENRLYYSSSSSAFSATSHYASDSKIAINTTTAQTENFYVNGTSYHKGSDTHEGNIIPSADGTYTLGETDKRWLTGYYTTSLIVGQKTNYTAATSKVAGSIIEVGKISTTNTNGNGGYYLYGVSGNNAAVEYGKFLISTIGSTSSTGEVQLILGNATGTGSNNNSCGRARIYHTNTHYGDYLANGWFSDGSIEEYTMLGATSNTSNTDAWTTLILGNNIAKSTTSAHSQGKIRIYSEGTTYTDIISQSGYSHTYLLPNYDNDMYAVHVGSTSAVGAGNQPTYVAANGRITACDTVVGDAYTPVYSNAGVLTETSPVQYATWTISNGNYGVTITSEAYRENTFVISLVVTSGEENLQSPLRWQTSTNSGGTTGNVTISSLSQVTGAVSGYVITARGTDLNLANNAYSQIASQPST